MKELRDNGISPDAINKFNKQCQTKLTNEILNNLQRFGAELIKK
jgi:hypothetical protein